MKVYIERGKECKCIFQTKSIGEGYVTMVTTLKKGILQFPSERKLYSREAEGARKVFEKTIDEYKKKGWKLAERV